MSRGPSSIASSVVDSVVDVVRESLSALTAPEPLGPVAVSRSAVGAEPVRAEPVGAEPIGIGLLLRHLWADLGFARALDPSGAAVGDAVFALVAQLAAPTHRSPAPDPAVAVPDSTWRRLERAAARACGQAGAIGGLVVMADRHGHAGTAPHHCAVRRPPWPGSGPGLDPRAHLLMAPAGAPLAFRVLPADAPPAPVTALLCAPAPALADDPGRPTADPPDALTRRGVVAGEHLRDLGDGQVLRAAAPRGWDEHDGITIHWLTSGANGVSTMLVRSPDEAGRERECREELVARLRTELATTGPGLADRLRGSRVRAWVTVTKGRARLNERAIERDARLDGHYLLHATTGRSDPGVAVAYLRFQDLARRAVRLAADVRPELYPAVGAALTLMWAAEQRAQRPWAEIADQLAGVHAVRWADGTAARTRLTDHQSALLRACGVPLS